MANPEQGRSLDPPVQVALWLLSLVAAGAGTVLLVTAAWGLHVGAWASAAPMTQGVLGAGMLGAATGCWSAARTETWEHARTLVWPCVVAVIGMFAVSVVDSSRLSLHDGIRLDDPATVSVVFSAGWVVVLGALSVVLVVALISQYGEPKRPWQQSVITVPSWARPLLGLLGSAWAGLGAALVVAPDFWGGFVPWATNHTDEHMLAVWSLAIGGGVLGALAEDDLRRMRPAVRSLAGIGALLVVASLVRRADVAWHTVGALAYLVLAGALLLTSVIGWAILTFTPWRYQR